MTPQEVLTKWSKNGITYGDVTKAYEDGKMDGAKEGGKLAYRSIYGAICVVMHDMHRFGKKRLYRLLRAVDQKVLESLTHTELIEEAWEKTGLQISFDQPFDRIEEVPK
jgi:hypothetical protein